MGEEVNSQVETLLLLPQKRHAILLNRRVKVEPSNQTSQGVEKMRQEQQVELSPLPRLEREIPSKYEIYRILSSYGGPCQVLCHAIISAARGKQGTILATVKWGKKHPMYEGHFIKIPVVPMAVWTEAVGHTMLLHAIIRNNMEGQVEGMNPLAKKAEVESLYPLSKGTFTVFAQPEDQQGNFNNRTFRYRGKVINRVGRDVARVKCEISLATEETTRKLILRSLR